MQKKTLKITTGAVILAIFAIMLLLNRQTGMMFEEFLFYFFPIPMVAFSAQYGWKNSIPVLMGMACFAFFFGTFTTIFYATSEALIGMILGGCIYKKVETTKTIGIIMLLSAFINVLNTIVLAGLFGIDLQEEIEEIQHLIDTIFARSGVVLPENLFTEHYIMQLMVISMIVMGLLQGFIIYQLSLLILRRLRFQIPKPKSIYSLFPPKWSGYIAVAFYFLCNFSFQKPLANEIMQNAIQAAGLCANLYLMIFGVIGMMLFLHVKTQIPAVVKVLICVAAFLIFPMLVMISGVIYIVSDYHKLATKEMDDWGRV